MPDSSNYTPIFQSVLAQQFAGHLKEKRAGGYRYGHEAKDLEKFDRFLSQVDHDGHDLPKELVERWIMKRERECPKTHFNRVVVLRQFTKYLSRQGMPVYIPPLGCTKRGPDVFTPYIFTMAEITRFLAEVDKFQPSSWSPRRHIVLPELFRLLIFCGLRTSEVLSLCVKDVNIEVGVLTIRNTKFGKDRLVPMSGSIAER